jgi:Septum formation
MTIPATIRALATAAALTLPVVALVSPASAGASTDPMVGAPTVGTCSTMTAAQAGARADHSTIVDCSVAHTAEVAGVVRLPSRLQWDTAGDRALYRVIARRCLPEVEAMLGRNTRTRDSSAYDLLWFRPTKTQIAEGARWLSCSVELRQARSLARLPTSTTPFLPAGTLPDKVARCLTRSALTTRCSARHRWRATGTFTVTGSYPGHRKLDTKANEKCRSRVTPGQPYRWTYQDKITWNVGGDHVVVCYSPTDS